MSSVAMETYSVHKYSEINKNAKLASDKPLTILCLHIIHKKLQLCTYLHVTLHSTTLTFALHLQDFSMLTLPLLLLSCLLSHAVWGYNFDTLVPTIVSSGIDISQGTDGFGFSLAQHELSDGTKM